MIMHPGYGNRSGTLTTVLTAATLLAVIASNGGGGAGGAVRGRGRRTCAGRALAVTRPGSTYTPACGTSCRTTTVKVAGPPPTRTGDPAVCVLPAASRRTSSNW